MSGAPFDEELLQARLMKAAAMPDFLHRRALEEIIARLADMERGFPRALLCAAAPAEGPDMLREALDIGELDHARGAHEMLAGLEPRSHDLIVSILGLGLVNDLPGALLAARLALRPGGVFMAALPAGDTFSELRAAWALADRELDGQPALRVAPFCSLDQLGALMQAAGFGEPVVDMERLTLRYAEALSLMREIRELGWANPLSKRPRQPVSRGRLARAVAHYEEAFSDPDNRIRATFEIAFLSGRSA